jgi:hypothetical protein
MYISAAKPSHPFQYVYQYIYRLPNVNTAANTRLLSPSTLYSSLRGRVHSLTSARARES